MSNSTQNINQDKVTFAFPSYHALWQFMEKTNAIHVRIEPRKNRISGKFGEKDIDLALEQFNAQCIGENELAVDTR